MPLRNQFTHLTVNRSLQWSWSYISGTSTAASPRLRLSAKKFRRTSGNREKKLAASCSRNLLMASSREGSSHLSSDMAGLPGQCRNYVWPLTSDPRWLLYTNELSGGPFYLHEVKYEDKGIILKMWDYCYRYWWYIKILLYTQQKKKSGHLF